MDVALMTMPVQEARSAWRAYRDSVKECPSPEYRALMRGYKALAQGRAVLDLFDVMKTAGVDHLHRPRLAIVNASATSVYFYGNRNGGGKFSSSPSSYSDSKRLTVVLPSETFTRNTIEWWKQTCRAVVPLIPATVRPAHHLQNYHVLWEAEWERVPVDPMLLRHLSGSLYAVLATWDLTPLEQAVLKGRLLR